MMRGAILHLDVAQTRALRVLRLLRRADLVPAPGGPARGLSARVRSRRRRQGARLSVHPEPKTFRLADGGVIKAPTLSSAGYSPAQRRQGRALAGRAARADRRSDARRRRPRLLRGAARLAVQDRGGRGPASRRCASPPISRWPRKAAIRSASRSSAPTAESAANRQRHLGRPLAKACCATTKSQLADGRAACCAGLFHRRQRRAPRAVTGQGADGRAIRAASPRWRNPDSVTMQEEEKIAAYLRRRHALRDPEPRGAAAMKAVNLEKLLPADIPPRRACAVVRAPGSDQPVAARLSRRLSSAYGSSR